MTTEIWFWLFSTLFWTGVMSFYSMQEMACISCNRLRLDYSVAQKKRWAILLHSLLENPTRLFGTTLIGVNVGLMLSSESSRQLCEAMNYDPNLAPIVFIPFALIFGELIPIFAARIYADHVSRLGIPILYFSAKLLSPLTAIVDFFFQQANRLMRAKKPKESSAFLSRDELQKMLEDHQGGYGAEQEAPVNAVISNIFSLRSKRAFQLMQSLDTFPCVPATASIATIRSLAATASFPCLPVYHRTKQKIVGITYLKDLLNASDGKKVDEYSKSPCFVNEEMQALELLFLLHDEEVQDAVVLNAKGEAIGIVLFETIVSELLESELELPSTTDTQSFLYLEKTLSADTKITAFNEEYGTNISPEECKTFAELVEKLLGRYPTSGDTITLGALELIVKETSLFKAKTILVRTKGP
jgi:putative hemolysin